MDNSVKEIVWNQMGASIDMLINVVSTCPEEYLSTGNRFYYLAFHATLFLDYYLTIPPADFNPLLAFSQKDISDRPKESIGDLIPDRIYSKFELVNYLKESRVKCKELINSLTVEKTNLRFTEGKEPGDMDYPILEILIYNMRHTQHHTAQLNMLMRQDLDSHMDWSFRAGDITGLD